MQKLLLKAGGLKYFLFVGFVSQALLAMAFASSQHLAEALPPAINWWAWDPHAPPMFYFLGNFLVMWLLLGIYALPHLKALLWERHYFIKKKVVEHRLQFADLRKEESKQQERQAHLAQELQQIQQNNILATEQEKEMLLQEAQRRIEELHQEYQYRQTQDDVMLKMRLQGVLAQNVIDRAYSKIMQVLDASTQQDLLKRAIEELVEAIGKQQKSQKHKNLDVLPAGSGPKYQSARRYAKVLAKTLADQAKTPAEIEGLLKQAWQEVRDFAALLAQQEPLKRLLADPTLSKDHLVVVQTLVTKLALSPLVQRVLVVLCEYHRLEILGELAEALEQLYHQQGGRVLVKVGVCQLLSEAQHQQLLLGLQKVLQQQVVLQVEVDKSVIGGLVCHIQDVTYDCGLKSALIRLKEQWVGL